MQCNQLIRLIKEWYVCVKQETMAPARMMEFVDRHIHQCSTCQRDADLPQEVEKIRDYVLPESKIPKAVRAKQKALTPEISPDEEEVPEREQEALAKGPPLTAG